MAEKCDHHGGGKHHHHHHHHHHGVGHTHGQTVGRIQFAFFLNLAFAVLELVGGFYTNSMAVLSDAVHDFGDALALGFAWYLERLSQKKGNAVFSYGFRRFSTMSALITGVILFVGAGLILATAIPRLLHPEQPKASGMLLLAVIGIAVNGWAAWRLAKGGSLNEKMIMWHLIEDVMGWVLVLVSSIAMMIWEVPILDSILALILSSWVLWNVFKNLKEAVKIFLQAVPSHLVMSDIARKIQELTIVKDLHHLHLWSIDGDSHIFTAHLVLPKGTEWQSICEVKMRIKNLLKAEFQIAETLLEVELEDDSCQDPEHL